MHQQHTRVSNCTDRQLIGYLSNDGSSVLFSLPSLQQLRHISYVRRSIRPCFNTTTHLVIESSEESDESACALKKTPMFCTGNHKQFIVIQCNYWPSIISTSFRKCCEFKLL